MSYQDNFPDALLPTNVDLAINCTKCGEPWDNSNHVCNSLRVLRLQEQVAILTQERKVPQAAYGVSLTLSQADIEYAARKFRERGVPHVADVRIRMGPLEREMTAQDFKDAIFNDKTPLPFEYWRIRVLAGRIVAYCELWRDNLGQPAEPHSDHYARCLLCNCENGAPWRPGEWHDNECIIPQIKKALATP